MKRTQRRAIEAEIQARGVLANDNLADSNAEDEMATGVDADVLSPTRTPILATREALAIALAALQETSEEHSRARERSRHALAVGICASTALPNFTEEDDGSLGNSDRDSAGELRDAHDAAIPDFYKLGAEIAETHTSEPALPVSGGDLDFVRERYETRVRNQADLTMAFA